MTRASERAPLVAKASFGDLSAVARVAAITKSLWDRVVSYAGE